MTFLFYVDNRSCTEYIPLNQTFQMMLLLAKLSIELGIRY